jgi:hypothetical protein
LPHQPGSTKKERGVGRRPCGAVWRGWGTVRGGVGRGPRGPPKTLLTVGLQPPPPTTTDPHAPVQSIKIVCATPRALPALGAAASLSQPHARLADRDSSAQALTTLTHPCKCRRLTSGRDRNDSATRHPAPSTTNMDRMTRRALQNGGTSPGTRRGGERRITNEKQRMKLQQLNLPGGVNLAGFGGFCLKLPARPPCTWPTSCPTTATCWELHIVVLNKSQSWHARSRRLMCSGACPPAPRSP